MPKIVFHLLPNAHLDPVWLWDWREGLNEGLRTVQAVLNLMDEFPRLTFIRGEAAIYEHIEKNDAALFKRLHRMVEAGRWDIVGGTYIQPDSNLTSEETLCRQFERGLRYFENRFAFRPTVSWQVDSFGHTPGWPNILHAFNMQGFAFTRPQQTEFPLPSPAFWWQGSHDNRLLCYRQHWAWYCSEQDNLPEVLDYTLQESARQPFRQVGIFMGLGNHGGGPSRQHILETEKWAAAHPEVEVRYSTLHNFFDALRNDLRHSGHQLPTVRNDLGFCLRGCYSSVMKFKSAFRHAETLMTQAETTQAIISSTFNTPGLPLKEAWDGILFNSFHDILPGTSIERAFEEQLSWIGFSTHQAQNALFQSLNQLALRMDTSVPAPDKNHLPADVPLLLWNPLPHTFNGQVELEACLNYRPLWKHPAGCGSLPLSLSGPDGEKPAFQEIRTEHHSMRDGAWRKRVVFSTEIPPLGWKIFHLGYREKASLPTFAGPANTAKRASNSAIANHRWHIGIDPQDHLHIRHQDKNFFHDTRRMQILTTDDAWGSWGGMKEEPESLHAGKTRHHWSLCDHAILEEGPERAALWTRWEAGNSWLDQTFHLSHDTEEISVSARLLWNERSARLQLILPATGALHMQTPGTQVERNQAGHLPCGRWFRRGNLGFISDVLSDIDATDDEIRITLARASRYADDVPTPPDTNRWLPAVDCGELKFKYWLTHNNTDLEHLSQTLLHRPVVLYPHTHPGKLPQSGSLGRLEPRQASLISACLTGDKNLSIRVKNNLPTEINASFTHGQRHFPLGTLPPHTIKNAILHLHPEDQATPTK
jgi:alpha-mannosidase